jgi:asparagine synthase (glutamine-hydrolysing)
VKYCLNYIAQHLSPGGIMVLDDYNDYPGCKKAADEFQAANPSYQFTRLKPHAVLVKTV